MGVNTLLIGQEDCSHREHVSEPSSFFFKDFPQVEHVCVISFESSVISAVRLLSVLNNLSHKEHKYDSSSVWTLKCEVK